MKTTPSIYRGYRFSADIISHCVWLYFRFPLSFRDIEEMMAERGITVSYETIRNWCEKFGRYYANQLRNQRGPLGDRWHIDEVFLKIHGRLHYLWRAVDQDGTVLDILVQPKRDKKAATRFFRKLLRGVRYSPRVVVTDKLSSYVAPCAQLFKSAIHVRDKRANNRAENSHQSTRMRERRMRRFKSASHAQKFLSIFGEINNLFSIARHALSAAHTRELLNCRYTQWRHIVGATSIAT